MLRYIDQTKSIEHSVNVGHTANISEGFRTAHHRTDLRSLFQSQQNGAPCQALAVFPPVDEQLLRIISGPSFLHAIGKGQSGIRSEGIDLKCNHHIPQRFCAAFRQQSFQSASPSSHPADALRVSMYTADCLNAIDTGISLSFHGFIPLLQKSRVNGTFVFHTAF